MEKLETGFYWIKLFNNSQWAVAYFNENDKKFSLIGTEKQTNSPYLIDYNKLQKNNNLNKLGFIHEKLIELSINEEFDRNNFLMNLWGKDDKYAIRSFDVLFTKIKKELLPKKFKTIRGKIVRIL